MRPPSSLLPTRLHRSRSPRSEQRADPVRRIVSLVDHPEELEVTESDEDGVTVYRLHVSSKDIGKVIGRRGRVARAMRTLLEGLLDSEPYEVHPRDRLTAKVATPSDDVMVIGEIAGSFGGASGENPAPSRSRTSRSALTISTEVFVGRQRRLVTVERVRKQGDRFLLKLEGGSTLPRQSTHFVAPSARHTPRQAKVLPEGHFYLEEIIDAAVFDETGEVGTVRDVLRTGSNEVFVVRGDAGERLIPAIADAIVSLDVAGEADRRAGVGAPAGDMTALRLRIVTLFPTMFESWQRQGLVARAIEAGAVDVELVDFRPFGVGRHLVTDDYPFGGGAGMVMKPEPLFAAVESLDRSQGTPVILLSPRGRRLTQGIVEELATRDDLIFICGHYEGVDERVREHIVTDELSIGDYVLGVENWRRWSSATPDHRGPACWQRDRRSRSRSVQGCSNIHSTRARRAFASGRCRRSSSRVITARSSAGAASRRTG